MNITNITELDIITKHKTLSARLVNISNNTDVIDTYQCINITDTLLLYVTVMMFTSLADKVLCLVLSIVLHAAVPEAQWESLSSTSSPKFSVLLLSARRRCPFTKVFGFLTPNRDPTEVFQEIVIFARSHFIAWRDESVIVSLYILSFRPPSARFIKTPALTDRL